MLTKIIIRNFKRFQNAEVELGQRVVLIGPNNSGKSSALQALALWHFGLIEWISKKSGKGLKKRRGVALNRRDFISLPIPETILLWKDKHVRSSYMQDGKQENENVKIEIEVEGLNNGKLWQFALVFDYGNKEAIYCRPIERDADKEELLEELQKIQVAFLPPMSGLASVEPKLEKGRINVLIGEGQTAQVLRNLCFNVYSDKELWSELNSKIYSLFGCKLNPPDYIAPRGEISMSYIDLQKIELDLSSSGRGFQQTLLLLAYLYSNPNAVLLLDEPDAHLEILRQRQIYQTISDVAAKQNSQVISASHSEVILNEAADKDLVIAFVGTPHRIDDRINQVLKSLKEIGFEQYYQAEQVGWVLYLEGSTDLAILQKLAQKLNHEGALKLLERPFVYYVCNQPNQAEKHFHGLREAKKDLVGIAIYDRLDVNLNQHEQFTQLMWKKREIENYFIDKDVLMQYVVSGLSNDLFGAHEQDIRIKLMEESINEITSALEVLNQPLPFTDDIKITDDFLDRVFDRFFQKLGQPNLMRKTDYFTLVDLYPAEKLDSEIKSVLDKIEEIAKRAKPLG